jgi:hypothetical protein
MELILSLSIAMTSLHPLKLYSPNDLVEESPDEAQSEKELNENRELKKNVEFPSPLQEETKEQNEEEEKKELPAEASPKARNGISVENESIVKDINFRLLELDR